MTDVKAPVSAPVFGQHIHFAIGPAPVAAPTVSHHNSTATEKDAKAGDGQPFNAASTSQNGTLSGSVAVPAVPAVSAGDFGDAKAEEEPAGAGSVPPAAANVSIGEKRKAEKDKGEGEADGAGDSRSNGSDGKEDMSEAAVSGALPLTVAPEATKETKTTANDGPAAKKAKVDAKTSLEDAASEETVNAVVETQTKKSNNNGSNTSSTRAKKEKKKPLPPVGRTARKTRSQGPADA